MIEDLHKQRAAQSDTTLGVVSSGPGEAHPPGQSGEPPAETSLPAIYPVPVVTDAQRLQLQRAIEYYRAASSVEVGGIFEDVSPPASTIREVYGHRIRTIDGEDWCVACGGSPSLWEECRPGAPRCDFCETAPADFTENGRRACSTGRCLAEARRAA